MTGPTFGTGSTPTATARTPAPRYSWTSPGSPTYSSSSRCAVATGRWYSYYDGLTWTNPSDVDIDHVVALKEAWESGARSWTSTNRTRFANNLAYGRSLVAVTDNASKGDRDPAQWLPPRSSVHCRYATTWLLIKYRWTRGKVQRAARPRPQLVRR